MKNMTPGSFEKKKEQYGSKTTTDGKSHSLA
jgi:hypothetical protein